MCINPVLLSTASPASSRKSAPSLSRTSSPSGSPKIGSGGRRPGRLRLPQLSSKHRLSNSKENLDGAANSESESQADTEGSPAGHLGVGDVMASESMCSTEASSSHCDVVLMNGDSNGLSSDCSIESSMDSDHPLLQHRDMCLDAIYNLYAISVSRGSTGSCLQLFPYCERYSCVFVPLFSQCHSGIMGGGHYVTYAKNPNKKWYCYNDSSCKVRHVSLYFGDQHRSLIRRAKRDPSTF